MNEDDIENVPPPSGDQEDTVSAEPNADRAAVAPAPTSVTDQSATAATVTLDEKYAAVLDRIVSAAEPVVEKLGLHYAILRSTGLIESYIVVIQNCDAAEEVLRHFIRGKFGHSRTVILVGGDQETERARLKKMKPIITSATVGLVHVDDKSAVWASRARKVEKVLNEGGPFEMPSQEALARLIQMNHAATGETADRNESAQAFVELLKARRPWATWTLIGVIISFFAMEFAFGGIESYPVLSRMGAHIHDRIVDHDEWYRGLSVALLHFGVPHLLFNCYVLFVLGSFLERVLGSSRFLALFVLAAAGGSAATFLRDEAALSVGASGALWGILVAQAILAWFGNGVFPDAMLGPARRAATFNLVANVIASTLPSIDWAAHLGGGIVGAILIGSGVLTRGLPRAHDPDLRAHTPVWLRPTAVGLTLTFAACAALALWNGRPWELRSNETERVAIADANATIALPKNLSKKAERVPDATYPGFVVRFGDTMMDAQFGTVTGQKLSPEDIAKNETAATITALTEELETRKVQNASSAGPVERSTDGDAHVVKRAWTFPNGLTMTDAWHVSTTQVVRTILYRWPEFSTPPANAIGRSVRFTSSPPTP